MSKSVKVVFENGVFKPLQKVNFKEHQKLELSMNKIVKEKPISDKKSPVCLIGLFESNIEDLSINHDSYLYSHPGNNDP